MTSSGGIRGHRGVNTIGDTGSINSHWEIPPSVHVAPVCVCVRVQQSMILVGFGDGSVITGGNVNTIPGHWGSQCEAKCCVVVKAATNSSRVVVGGDTASHALASRHVGESGQALSVWQACSCLARVCQEGCSYY